MNIFMKLFKKCDVCKKRCGLTKRIVKCKDCGKAIHLKCLLAKHDHQNKHNTIENNNKDNDEKGNPNSNKNDKKEENNHNDNDDQNKHNPIENNNNDNDKNSNSNIYDKEEENNHNDNDDQNKHNPIENNNNDNDQKENFNSNKNNKEEENNYNDNGKNEYNISENDTMEKYNFTAVIISSNQEKDVCRKNDDCENEEEVPEIIDQAIWEKEDTNTKKTNETIKRKEKDHHSWSQLENEITNFFQSIPKNCATESDFSQIAKLCGCPLYLKKPLYDACGGGLNKTILLKTFLKFWKSVWSRCKGMPAILIYILSKSAVTKYLYPDNFQSLVQDVVNTHPGLKNLKKATVYHSLYIKTVISRIFFDVDVSWSGKIDAEEIGNSKLISVLESLESDRHINKPESYFNYKHFFAIHHYFDLHRDNNNVTIKKSELKRYKNYALNPRIIDSLFFGNVVKRNRSSCKGEEYMSYDDFVCFVMAEENKSHPRAVEYWFRCMDVDNDGLLNYDDLEFYYEEQIKRIKNKKLTRVNPTMNDLYRSLDRIYPKLKRRRRISLEEFKNNRMTTMFINQLVNVEKYLRYQYFVEHNTSITRSTVDVDDRSDWEKFTQNVYDNYAPARQNIVNNSGKKTRRGGVKYKKKGDNKRKRYYDYQEIEDNALMNTNDIENHALPNTLSNS